MPSAAAGPTSTETKFETFKKAFLFVFFIFFVQANADLPPLLAIVPLKPFAAEAEAEAEADDDDDDAYEDLLLLNTTNDRAELARPEFSLLLSRVVISSEQQY